MEPANQIRTTNHHGEKLPHASDMIEYLLGVVNGRQTWNKLKKEFPDIQDHCVTENIQGGKADYLTKDAFRLMVVRLNPRKQKGKDGIKLFKDNTLFVIDRYFTGDDSLIDYDDMYPDNWDTLYMERY